MNLSPHRTPALVGLGSLALVALAVPLGGCFEEEGCTLPYIILDMEFDAELPASTSTSVIGTQLELCIGVACDTSVLEIAQGTDVSAGDVRCTDADRRSEKFQTQCSGDAEGLRFRVNTAYDGHEGEDPLVLTAIDASGARTVILTGTVTYVDATTSSSSGACGAPFYRGTFTKTP